jgi:hypothetical protein
MDTLVSVVSKAPRSAQRLLHATATSQTQRWSILAPSNRCSPHQTKFKELA